MWKLCSEPLEEIVIYDIEVLFEFLPYVVMLDVFLDLLADLGKKLQTFISVLST